jgi:hypothetical protein
MNKPLSKTESAVMAVVEASALHGKTCPRLPALSALLGVSTDSIRDAFRSLQHKGVILYETPYCGMGVGKVRVVRILATGLETARPKMASRPAGSLAAAKTDRNEIERAKTKLRRLGYVVFDATVTDGSAGTGLIKIDNKNVSPADVLARAAALGRV